MKSGELRRQWKSVTNQKEKDKETQKKLAPLKHMLRVSAVEAIRRESSCEKLFKERFYRRRRVLL